jgi:hypothetical protein
MGGAASMLDHPVELLRPFAFAAANNNTYILLHDRHIYTYDSDETEIMDEQDVAAMLAVADWGVWDAHI